jgi:cellulose synthase operon protein C
VGRASAVVLFCAANACTSSPIDAQNTPPLALAVTPAGCVAYWSGPRCVLDARGHLELIVRAPAPEAEIEIEADAQPEIRTSTSGKETLRYRLRFHQGTPHLLKVTAKTATASWEYQLPLEPPSGGALVAELEALAQKDGTAADLRAKNLLPELSAGPRAEVLDWWSREEFGRGNLEASIARAEETIEAARAGDRAEKGAASALRIAYIATIELKRFTLARSALAAIDPEWKKSWPLAATQSHYYEGILARTIGDFSTALDQFARAEKAAEAVSSVGDLVAAQIERAMTLVALGRPGDALDPLLRAKALLPPDAYADIADARVSLAWAALLAIESGAASKVDIQQELKAALEYYRGPKPTAPEYLSNVYVNLALDAWQRGSSEQSHEYLREARGLALRPDAEGWALEIEGRLALADKKYDVAIASYRSLITLARKNDDPALEWQGLYGAGKSAAARGDRTGAIAALQGAEALLGSDRFQIPVDAGQVRFLGAHEGSARGLVEALVLEQQPAQAFDVARKARRRGLLAVHNLSRVSELGEVARANWERTYSDYLAAREAVEKARRELEVARRASKELIAARRAKVAELEEAVVTARRRALEILREDRPQRLAEGALRKPADKELWLLWVRTTEEWIAFAASSSGVVAVRLGNGTVDAHARWLIEPLREHIERAERVILLPTGELGSLALHALPFGDSTLARARATVYGLDLPEAQPLAITHENVLVVADGRGDLPGARRAAKEIEASFRKEGRGVNVRLQNEATTAEVQKLLAASDWFHYAGHGDHLGLEGWGSRLLLAGRDDLDVSDVLALPGAPKRVVLMACEAAHNTADAKVATSFGIAHAFVLAGANEVLAPSEIVPDDEAAELTRVLYELLPGASSLAEAFRTISHKNISTSAYRVLVP